NSGLVVAHGDLKRFVDHAAGAVELEVRAMALTGEVEGVSGVEANRFILGRVINVILAGEFQLAVFIAAIKTDAASRQWHADLVVGAILELLHHPNLWIRKNTEALLLAE